MSKRRFVVWHPENGQVEGDGKKVNARDAGEAVETWAEWDDVNSAEYHILSGHPARVMVRDVDSGEASEWIVSGEYMPQYTTLKIAAGGEG